MEGGRRARVVVLVLPPLAVGNILRLSASTTPRSISLLEDAMRLVDVLLLRGVEGKLGSRMLTQPITKMPLRRLQLLLHTCTLRLGRLDSLRGACNGLGGLVDRRDLSVEAESVLPTGPQRTDAFAPKSSVIGSSCATLSTIVINFTCSCVTLRTTSIIAICRSAAVVFHVELLGRPRRSLPRCAAPRQPRPLRAWLKDMGNRTVLLLLLMVLLMLMLLLMALMMRFLTRLIHSATRWTLRNFATGMPSLQAALGAEVMF